MLIDQLCGIVTCFQSQVHFVDHFLICMAHQPAWQSHQARPLIFVVELMGAYVGYPVGLMVGVLLTISHAGVGARDWMRLLMFAPKFRPMAMIPRGGHRLRP